jgi:hypothetical protein
VLVPVPPAPPLAGRSLLAVRDALVEGGATVVAPCRGAKRCPLLATPGSWCHTALAWRPPASAVALMRAARLDDEMLQASYLVVGPRAPRRGLRVVSGAMRAGDAVRRYACGADGLVTLRSSDRDPLAARARGALVVDVPAAVVIERDDRSRRAKSGGRGDARASSSRRKTRSRPGA